MSKVMTPTVKNMFSPSERVVSPKGIKPAKQEFKDDADLNSIMRKFQKSDAIDHFAKYQGEYGGIGPANLQQAMNTVITAQTMFDELPSSVRNRFSNSPQDFLEFVQNPDNYQEAQELNIGLAPEAEAIAIERQEAAKSEPVVAEPPPPAPEGPVV